MRTLLAVAVMLVLTAPFHPVSAQPDCISVNNLIDLFYKSGNARLRVIRKKIEASALTFENSRSVYRPVAKIDAAIPYSKSIESVLQPDGNSIYTERQYLSPSYVLSASKVIPLTGGTIGFSTSLNYFKNFLNSNQQFNANWYNIYISQPLLAYNELRYNLRLQQLILSDDSVQFYRECENELRSFIDNAVEYELLKLSIDYNREAVRIQDSALQRLKTLFDNGRALAIDTVTLSISINRLHLLTSQLISDAALRKKSLDYALAEPYTYSLCALEPEARTYLIDSSVLRSRYLRYHNHNQLTVEKYMISENVNRARLAHGITASVSAGNGVNQTSAAFGALFDQPAQRQNVTLITTVPLTGWDRFARSRRIAMLQHEAAELARQDAAFESSRWSLEQLAKYTNLITSLQFSKDRLRSLQDLGSIQLEKLMAGRITAIEFDLVQSSILSARLDMLGLLRQILAFRFDLRAETLYDFELMKNVY